MQPFRPTRRGGVRAWLAASEASLLRSLIGQVMALIGPDDDPQIPPDPEDHGAADEAGEADEVAALEALLLEPSPGESRPALAAPTDPVLARLLPDAYRDDPEAAGEFRKYTEPALRTEKQQAARLMLDTLPEAGGRIQLTHEQALAWLKALNDVRLALGVRLDVTEDFEEDWARLDASDPRWTAYEVYAWLGAVQESLVHALAR